MTDDELIAGFESGRLASLPHGDHVRVAWVYLRRLGLHGALAAVSQGLRRLSAAHGQADKYHETVSWLYVFVIHERMAIGDGGLDWESFAEANPDLFSAWGAFVRRYYAPQTLSSALARRSFVLPDRLAQNDAPATGLRPEDRGDPGGGRVRRTEASADRRATRPLVRAAATAFAAGIWLLCAGSMRAASPAAPRPAGWPPVSDDEIVRDGAVVQLTRTMSLDLPAPADATFPLFGPIRESEWSPGWEPAFVTPVKGAQSPDGAVFTTGGKEKPVVWVMTDYDAAARIVRYVHLLPGRLVTQLWIQVRSVSHGASRADVTFRHTILGPEGRDDLAHFSNAFPQFREHWEHAIAAALARDKGEHPQP